jgi:hypothetical protein
VPTSGTFPRSTGRIVKSNLGNACELRWQLRGEWDCTTARLKRFAKTTDGQPPTATRPLVAGSIHLQVSRRELSKTRRKRALTGFE